MMSLVHTLLYGSYLVFINVVFYFVLSHYTSYHIKEFGNFNSLFSRLDEMSEMGKQRPENDLSVTRADVKQFPPGFKFGVATAAYQIEGAWNVSDKGENIWDHFTHFHPELVANHENADVACDSYHQYKRDVEMLKYLGVDFYRFSLSWSRLLPNGFTNKVSEDGVRYYNELIDELLANNIEPMVTLYHWDLPQDLQELGGWANERTAQYFADYADKVFELFGDRVKMWITFNEPQVFCQQGYGNVQKAPGINKSGIADYLCGHTVLLAHAKAYHIYNDKYRSVQRGRIGITLSGSWHIPASNSSDDNHAAELAKMFEMGWFTNPIFSKEGDYPKLMKDRIALRSKEQGFSRSRLPTFTQEEVDYIKGTSDFYGFNHYTTRTERRSTTEDVNYISYLDDRGAVPSQLEEWPTAASSWLKVVPWGFRDLLLWIKDTYDNPEIIITENGYSDFGGLNDENRCNYLRDYMANMLEAMDKGCWITGYAVWSLMDNFEWQRGYRERFGLFYTDYNTPNRERTPKASADYYKQVIATKSLTA